MRVASVRFDPIWIEEIFAHLGKCDGPGAVVGIAIHGKPVLRKGYGLANIELPIVLSPATRMRIASITKHFAALAFMLLCEDGKAALDDPVGRFLPELHPVTHRVTVGELMGHVSGLRDAHDISWQFSGTERSVSSADLLSLYCRISDINAEPSSAWMYSNGGYLILSAIIERISGERLEDVLKQRIFDPLGMSDTLLRRSETRLLPNSSIAHMTTVAGDYEKSNFFGTEWAGEGGMVSTVDDMLRWLAHMDAPIVGSEHTWKALTTPQVLKNGTSTGYGLGLTIDRYRGVDILYHPGGGLGFNAWMLKVPACALDVVVMSNRQDASSGELVYKILDACIADLAPARSASFSPVASGVFHSEKSGRVVHLRAATESVCSSFWQSAQIASMDGRDMPIIFDGVATFRPSGPYHHLKLSLTVEGPFTNPTGLRLEEFGDADHFVTVGQSSETGNLGGTYRCESVDVEAAVFDAGEMLRLRTVGAFGTAEFKLERLADRIFRAMPLSSVPYLGGILSFDPAGSSFRFSSIRTRGLRFQRLSRRNS